MSIDIDLQLNIGNLLLSISSGLGIRLSHTPYVKLPYQNR